MVISKKTSIILSRGNDQKSFEKSEHPDPVRSKHLQNDIERRRFSDSLGDIGTVVHTPLNRSIRGRTILSKGITSNNLSREDGVGTQRWVGRLLTYDSQIFSKTTSCLPDINDRVKYCTATKGHCNFEYILYSVE